MRYYFALIGCILLAGAHDSADPGRALIASLLHTWAAPLGMAVLGSGSLLAYAG